MKITEQELINEIEKMYNLLDMYSMEFHEKYLKIDENVKSYVYAKSTPIHRGYYNPTIAAHIAIGGNQKGRKPKKEPPKNGGGYDIYGLDEHNRPIYIQPMLSNGQKACYYEIVSYIDDSIIGITFGPADICSIHVSRFVEEKIKSIIFCSFNLSGNKDYHGCHNIEMEVYQYDKPNHFIWSFTSYDPNWKQYIEYFKSLNIDLAIDITKPVIDQMEYEFDTNPKGKLLRMYNEYREKDFIKRPKTSNKINQFPKTKESKKIFNKMLTDSNISPKNFSISSFLSLVREFMNLKFDCAEDDLLFEAGVFESMHGKDTFIIDFARQFSINDENDVYEHMEQLHITLHFDNSDKLMDFHTMEWSTDYDSIDDFFSFINSSSIISNMAFGVKLKSIAINHELV
jgi:hypothetical protein